MVDGATVYNMYGMTVPYIKMEYLEYCGLLWGDGLKIIL